MSFVDFTDWTDLMGNNLIQFQVYEKIESKVKVHMSYENVVEQNIPANQFYAWFVPTRDKRKRGIVGVDNDKNYIMRVDIIQYPIAKTFKKSTVVKNLSTNKLYKLLMDSTMGDFLNMAWFEVKEVE